MYKAETIPSPSIVVQELGTKAEIMRSRSIFVQELGTRRFIAA